MDDFKPLDEERDILPGSAMKAKKKKQIVSSVTERKFHQVLH